MAVVTTLGLNHGPIEQKDGLYCGVNLSVLNAASVNGGMVMLPLTINGDRVAEVLTGKRCYGITYRDADRLKRDYVDPLLAGYEIVNVRIEDMQDKGLLINADIRVLATPTGVLLKTLLDKPGELNFHLVAQGMYSPGDIFTIHAITSFDLILDTKKV